MSRLSKLLLRLTQYPLEEEGIRDKERGKEGERGTNRIEREGGERESERRKARIFCKSSSRHFTNKELDCKAQINIIRQGSKMSASRHQGNAENTKNSE